MPYHSTPDLLRPKWVLAGTLLLVLLTAIPSVDNALRLGALNKDIAELHTSNVLLNRIRVSSRNLLGAVINGDGVSDSSSRARVILSGKELSGLLDSIEGRFQSRYDGRSTTLEDIRKVKRDCDSTNRVLEILVSDITLFGINGQRLPDQTPAFRDFTRWRQMMLMHFDAIVENQENEILRIESAIHSRSINGLAIFAGFITLMGTLAVVVYRNALRSIRTVQRSEAGQSAILTSVGDTMWAIDTEYNVQFFSPQLLVEQAKLGLPKAEIGMDARGLVPASARDWWVDLYDNILSGKMMRVERSAAVPTPNSFTYDITGTPILQSGQVVGAVLVVRDISHTKAYERQLIRERELAEEMTQLKSDFLSNMSHELRTPMIGVLGYADLIAEESGKPDIREYAERISTSGRRLLSTLSAILEMSRIQSSTGIRASEFDVIDIITNAMDTLRNAADLKHLTLRLHTSSDTCIVMLDADYVTRIVNNLIDNAVKFTNEGSVEVFVQEEGSESVVIAVKDTGVGIDAAYIDTIFEHFEQESTGIARGYEGTGLGLAITKKCADALGGKISVTSEKGIGSTFTVTLPRGVVAEVVG